MAEGNIPDISYRINTEANLGGLQAHTAAVRDDTRAVEQQKVAYEALTNTGSGLATSAAGLSGAMSGSGAYAIKNEAEYAQAVKLMEGYQKLAMSKRLLGIEDEALTAKIAVLDAALSTESALTVAETMESKALAAAKAQLVADEEAAAAAALEEAGAHKVNSVAMRESMVISRELMSGNISRLPGSAGMLAGSLGFAEAMPAILGVSVALMAGFELWKKYQKGVQDTKDELVEFKREAEHAAFAIDMAVNKAKDSAAKFYDELDRIVNKTESITEAMQALNKMQEETARLTEAVAKTKDAAEESDIRKMKDPIAKAQAEYRLKEEEDKRANAEADKAGREKYANALKAAKDAGAAFNEAVAGKDNAQSTEHLKPLVAEATREQAKATTDKSAQEKALATFKKLGLNEEQIEAILSGKSLRELTKDVTHEEEHMSASGSPYYSQHTDKRAPIQLSGSKLEEFSNAFKQFSGSLGGKSYAEQPQRFEHTESNLKTITTLFDEAQKKADALGAEFQKLTDDLPKLAQQLNEESAKRNQDAREKNIKNLDALSAAYEAAAKRIEDAYKDKPAPQEAVAKDAELKSVISELSVAIHTLAGAHDAGSTAFQGFGKGGKPLGPGDVSPNFDFSPLKNLVKKMHDDVQNQFNKTVHELQSQITSATGG